MRTVIDDVGLGPITIRDIDDIDVLTDERTTPRRDCSEDGAMLGGQRHRIGINYRPDRPPQAALANAVDNGPLPAPANDNRPVRYHLKEMAQRGDLGVNEPENRRHWFNAERLKRDMATSNGEPLSESASDDWRELAMDYMGEALRSFDSDNGLALSDDMEFEDGGAPNGGCSVVDNDASEPDGERAIRSKQIIALAVEVLGPDFAVLKSAIQDNWTSRTIGENELFMDRVTAAACGKGMLRSALRNLTRFYDGLDRLEATGERPHDVWPLIGTHSKQYPPVVRSRDFPWRGVSYLNQSRNYVIRVAEPALSA